MFLRSEFVVILTGESDGFNSREFIYFSLNLGLLILSGGEDNY